MMGNRRSNKLFHVLVVGGFAIATPACSSDPAAPGSGAQSDAGSGKDSAAGDSGADAAVITDAMMAADVCLNTPGDCTHGLCSW
jgi:hypothetical protein